ncbi:hypothetical protein NDU88_005275 [Pleurodeles waltl]|uniref:Uncharacterized protein n=1 Tax=Pleurodeles waltl TaxID=8319 RepID=A0AAV7QID7_PLEWA|nr:hypothetical protein NDU88_005275 [Pleurodeles waltl]
MVRWGLDWPRGNHRLQCRSTLAWRITWGLWRLAVGPEALEVGGRSPAVQRLVAGLLVLLRGNGLVAQASGPGLIQGLEQWQEKRS